MKRLLLITGIILAVYLVLNTAASVKTSEPSAAVAYSVVSDANEEFLICDQDGYIAVFKGGELYLKTDTVISSLPKSDQTQIVQGIHVSSVEELKKLLEDYCS